MSQSAGSLRRWIRVDQSTTCMSVFNPAAFNAESDAKKRGALWGNIQSVVYTEVPYIRVGNFNSVTARSSKLDGYVAMPWPFFWNTGLQK